MSTIDTTNAHACAIPPLSDIVCCSERHRGAASQPFDVPSITQGLMWVGESAYDILEEKHAAQAHRSQHNDCETTHQEIPSFPCSVSKPKQDIVADAVTEYVRFLSLLVLQFDSHISDTLLTPSLLVDELWHTHVLHSREYFSFW